MLWISLFLLSLILLAFFYFPENPKKNIPLTKNFPVTLKSPILNKKIKSLLEKTEIYNKTTTDEISAIFYSENNSLNLSNKMGNLIDQKNLHNINKEDVLNLINKKINNILSKSKILRVENYLKTLWIIYGNNDSSNLLLTKLLDMTGQKKALLAKSIDPIGISYMAFLFDTLERASNKSINFIICDLSNYTNLNINSIKHFAKTNKMNSFEFLYVIDTLTINRSIYRTIGKMNSYLNGIILKNTENSRYALSYALSITEDYKVPIRAIWSRESNMIFSEHK